MARMVSYPKKKAKSIKFPKNRSALEPGSDAALLINPECNREVPALH